MCMKFDCLKCVIILFDCENPNLWCYCRCSKRNFLFLFTFFSGLLRLQQIYQGLRPGNETFQVETVKRIANATNAIDFLRTLEELNRWSKKFIVLDCPTDMAKDIVVYHVRDLSLGRRTYHYLLSGLVSSSHSQLCVCVCTLYFVWTNFIHLYLICTYFVLSYVSSFCSSYYWARYCPFIVPVPIFLVFSSISRTLSFHICPVKSARAFFLWLYFFVRLLLLHHRHELH